MKQANALECRETTPGTAHPRVERPREKLMGRGPGALSDAELVAIMLGTGRKGRDALALAAEALDELYRLGAGDDPSGLSAIRGIGTAKACVLAAALEFGRRKFRPGDLKITCPGDAWRVMSHYADRKQERFVVISMNGAHEVIATRVISVGLLNRAIVHPREVFADPLTDRAAGVVVGHNHPSGNVEPSAEDRDITRKLREAGEVLGVPLVDHVVFSHASFWSFKENGW